ncbi:MAG TPA: 4-hydroxy-tetrahydrodipicolinate synthase [Oculatellaceae cyanobacterium]|jgi:4-hydroxy-tetrahydrodipicolinate synthase
MPHLSAELIPAMLTPFKRDGSVDFEKAEKLALHLVENGCDGILVNGTTGECPTMSFDEKIELLKVVKHALQGKNVQLMAGVGTNDTHKTVEEAKKTAAIGVDAILTVVPYYNKPSQRGMQEHFRQVAKAVDTEIVIYNIPSRSVVLMSPDTMAALHRECPNIIGVKQSHPDMDQVSEITAKLPQDTWRTWCGDDSLTVPMIACGAYGTISVLAHLTGNLMRDMIQAAKRGDRQKALELHLKQLNLAREIFFLPNPTVIKTCMAKLGYMEPVLRPPMVLPDETEMARIDALLEEVKKLTRQPVA